MDRDLFQHLNYQIINSYLLTYLIDNTNIYTYPIDNTLKKKKLVFIMTNFQSLQHFSCSKQNTRVSKVFEYFGNMRHNSAVPDVFTKIVKMTNHTGLYDDDDDASWSSWSWSCLRATHLICLYGLKQKVLEPCNILLLYQLHFHLLDYIISPV